MRLDAAHVGRARGLAEQLEQPDLGGVAHVGAAAQLARERAVADLDHAHDVAVLLAEQRHRAEPLGLVERGGDARARAGSRGSSSLTWSSTSRSSSAAQRLAVGEVEAQLVGADVGAGLAHVAAQPPAQRGVQQVRRGVVALGGVAGGAVDVGAHALAGLDRAVLGHQRHAPGRRRGAGRPPRARGSLRHRTRRSPSRPPGRRRWRRTATRRA